MVGGERAQPMRSTQHDIKRSPIFRMMLAGGAILLALTTAGCSAVNMTGFSMPVFGLTKKSKAETDSMATAAISSEEGVPAKQLNGLVDKY